jgi:hypothetical protein
MPLRVVFTAEFLRLLTLAALCSVLMSVRLAGKTPYSHGDPTALEQTLLELINAARTNPAAEGRFLDGITTPYAVQARVDSPSYFTNLPGEFSAYPAAPPLAFHPILTATARAHSRDMVSKGYFAHASLDGMTPADRILKAGYDYDFAGENISGMGVTNAADALECHYGLMIDNNNIEDATSHLGHRLNILDKDFAEIGIGYSGSRSGGDATEDFGTPSNPAAYLVGVAFNDLNTNGTYDPGEGKSNVQVMPDLGNRYAVTSASGGFAIPLEPLETNTDTLNLPFDVQSADWSDVEPYDTSYREGKLSNAPVLNVRLVWSGGGLTNSYSSTVTIKRPTLINYRIIGTDDYYYNRQLLTSRNVKADLVLDQIGSPVLGRGVTPVKASQVISFTPLANVSYSSGLTLGLSGSATSGLPVSFSSAPTNIAVIEGTNLRVLGAGTVSITANQAGDDSYLPATKVVRSLVIAKGVGAVSFSPLDPVAFASGKTVPLRSLATANLSARYTSSTPAVAKVSGTNLVVIGVGSAVITAAIPASANYTAASVRQTLLVTKGSQTISFPQYSTNVFSPNKVLNLPAKSSSGLPVILSSSDPTILGVSGARGIMKRRGTVLVTARQSGNANYLPATSVTNSITLR